MLGKGKTMKTTTKALAIATAGAALSFGSSAFASDNILWVPEGDGSPAVSVGSFDWAPGNTVSVDGTTAVTNFLLNEGDGGDRDTSFTTYFHAHLATTDVGSPPGLGIDGPFPADYEYTVVLGFRESVQQIDFATGKVTTTFDFISGSPNFFEIYYDDIDGSIVDGDLNSNALAGTGYNDGTLVLSGTVVSAGSNFAIHVDDVTGVPTVSDFDQFGANDYPGVTSVEGNGLTDPSTGGTTALEVEVGFQHSDFFPASISIIALEFSTDQITPFLNVNPSALFWDGTTLFAPDYGTVNGLAEIDGGGPDFQFETDGRNTFTATREIPEPMTAGLGLIALGGAALAATRRRRA